MIVCADVLLGVGVAANGEGFRGRWLWLHFPCGRVDFSVFGDPLFSVLYFSGVVSAGLRPE